MEGERSAGPSPDTHGRIGGGREGGGLEWNGKEEEDTGSRPSSIPLPQKETSSYRIWQSIIWKSERLRRKISAESQTSQETEACVSCESFEWSEQTIIRRLGKPEGVRCCCLHVYRVERPTVRPSQVEGEKEEEEG